MELGASERQRVLAELRNAMGQVRKASEIISHLRTFGRAAPVSREPVALNDVIERALALMHQQLRLRQIEVTVELCSDSFMVIGNAIQIEQVFINLLNNSRDAVANAPERRIDILCSIDDGIAEIRFRDTGPGIPEGLEQRIFDPFFTTKEVGEGTGLGLSITYSIVKDHDGTISVEKTPPSGGAVFLIRLPLASGEFQMESLI
jgi:C4-dicarboxylate-specific signal transduction histidine kinase